jgi:predicted RecA/RadA family phage recombinase
MSRNIVHQGGPADVMPWTNNTGSDVASGAVVAMKHTVGVALVAIKNGAVGSVAIGGVVSGVAKVTGRAWAQGEKLVYDIDSGSGAFDNSTIASATGDVAGGAIAWLAAASGDTSGTIKLTPGNNVSGADPDSTAANTTSITNLNAWATALATKLNADAGVTDTNYDTDPQS